MPFNADDYTKAPWNSGCMTLTNEECAEVKGHCEEIIEAFTPNNYYSEPNTMYVVSTYNDLDWKKAINGDTYDVLTSYNLDFNTQGINENGIVPEPVIEEPEEEAPIEGETIPEEETPVVDETEAPAEDVQPTEEETVEEAPVEEAAPTEEV